MTQNEIHEALRWHFSDGWMHLSNVYLFSWESDFCCWLDKKYWIEVEVKVSRSDFQRDFTHKPEKHRMLEQAMKLKRGMVLSGVPHQVHTNHIDNGRGLTAEATFLRRRFIPHRFYFAAPQGLIKPHEVPKYAGLIELMPASSLRPTQLAKRPVTLHKQPLEIMEQVAVKQHFKIEQMRRELESLRQKLKTADPA